MIKFLRELFLLLSLKQRKGFYILQILVVFMSFTEILGVASIAPFMALVGDKTILDSGNVISKIYNYLEFYSKEDFILLSGIVVLILLSFSTIISTFTTWKLTMYGTNVGMELGNRLYSYYMKQSWLFHSNNNSSELTKKVVTETDRVTSGIIKPILQINAKIILSIFMLLGIFTYDPFIALSGLIIFLSAYYLIYRMVKVRLKNYGQNISNEATTRFKLINEGFGGIKDILLLGRQNNFIDLFTKSGTKMARSIGMNIVISQIPRYLMELVAFGTIVLLVLYLVERYDGEIGFMLGILSMYVLVGFKLLPAFQSIYSSLSTIRGNISAFDSIREDLKKSLDLTQEDNSNTSDKIKFNKVINFDNIYFKYPNKSCYVLENFSLTINKNTAVGFVGPSGSGKSTAIDILMGLVMPETGNLKVDDVSINNNNVRCWQNNIGFVAQSIFLSERTIAENIAFGIPNNQIDVEQVNNALKLAHLNEFIDELPNGINTKVGERGVQLSGGQRQRIGIARALYHNSNILVFDEATSALDGITEKVIMDAIHDFGGKKTIIMIAHRLKTVERCDKIYFIDKGKVIDSGTYHELLEKNRHFKEMAKYA